jgi:hypothetical protein
MSLKSFVHTARFNIALLGVAACLLTGCSEGLTEPVAESAPTPGLAATTFSLSGALTLASHTNLSDWNDDDEDFVGMVPFSGATVRLRNAKGSVIQSGSTNSAGEFHLEASKIPARLEFALGGGVTYTIALGSIDAGTTIVRSKLTHDGTGPVMNAELFPDDDLNAVPDDGIGTQVMGLIAGNPMSGQEATTAEGQIEGTSAELESIVLSQLGTKLADKLEDVVKKTRDALEELAETPSDPEGALGKLEGAVGDLEAAVKDGLLDATTGNRFIEQLTVVARQAATETLDQAIARATFPDLISQAQGSVAEGDALRQANRCKDAMNKYQDALSKARSALS